MTGNSENILEINSIEVMYDSVISALHDVSLDVPRGKIVALLGGNGAGVGRKKMLRPLNSGRKYHSGSLFAQTKKITN